MADGMKKFVESATNARYVKFGSHCSVCSKKLGFFETGFWSINGNKIADGALCKSCAEKAHDYILNKRKWMKSAQYKSEPWNLYGGRNWNEMSVETVKALFVLKENSETEIIKKHGKTSGAFFRVEYCEQIAPNSLEVGIARAKKLRNKTVAFGTTDTGLFAKGDIVTVESSSDGTTKETTILEAYVWDCDENTLLVNLKAHMGKQSIPEGKKGWLVLSIESGVNPDDIIIK